MKIEYIKAHEGRQPGYVTDVLRSKAADLVAIGVAKICTDQSRDVPPIKKPEEQPQNITVNNYYLTPEPEDEEQDFQTQKIKDNADNWNS